MSLREKRKLILPDLIFSKFFLIFCVILFVIVLFAFAKGTVKSYKVDSEIQELQEEIGQLERQNQDFSQLVTYLKSDAFVEQEAKLKLGFKKPGENLVVIPQEEIKVEEEKLDDSEITQNNPAKWWAYFFKR